MTTHLRAGAEAGRNERLAWGGNEGFIVLLLPFLCIVPLLESFTLFSSSLQASTFQPKSIDEECDVALPSHQSWLSGWTWKWSSLLVELFSLEPVQMEWGQRHLAISLSQSDMRIWFNEFAASSRLDPPADFQIFSCLAANLSPKKQPISIIPEPGGSCGPSGLFDSFAGEGVVAGLLAILNTISLRIM